MPSRVNRSIALVSGPLAARSSIRCRRPARRRRRRGLPCAQASVAAAAARGQRRRSGGSEAWRFSRCSQAKSGRGSQASFRRHCSEFRVWRVSVARTRAARRWPATSIRRGRACRSGCRPGSTAHARSVPRSSSSLSLPEQPALDRLVGLADRTALPGASRSTNVGRDADRLHLDRPGRRSRRGTGGASSGRSPA